MKLKVIALLALAITLIFPVIMPSSKALSGETETVLAMDMEQLIVLEPLSPSGYSMQHTMLMDASPYRNHGEPLPYNQSSPYYYGPTKVRSIMAYGLEFDGVDDYVNIPHSSELDLGDPGEAYTVMAWIKPYNLTKAQDIIAKKTTNYPFLFRIDASSNLIFELYDGGSNPKVQYQLNSTTDTNMWVHIAGVRNPDTAVNKMLLYLNGELVHNVTGVGGDASNSVDVKIGYANNYFEGIVDEVRIYPLALNERQIQTDMRTQILVNRQHRWEYYFDNVNDWKTTPTAGVHSYLENDPSLPSIKRDDTYSIVHLNRYDYIMGFRDFEINAVFEDTTADTVADQAQSFGFWMYFFKDGIWQTAYKIFLYSGSAGANATEWRAQALIVSRIAGLSNFRSYTWNCSNTQDFTSWPFLVQAWTTEDGRQIAFRIATNQNTTDGVGNYMFSYYFDLVDENGNPQYLEWFDPYSVRMLRLAASNQDGYVRIIRHNWDIIEELLKIVNSIFYPNVFRQEHPIGALWGPPIASVIRWAVGGGETSARHDPNEEEGNGDGGGPNPLLDPLGFIAYQLRNIATTISNILGEPLRIIGTTIMNALMSMAQPIIETLTNVAIAIWDFIATGIDGLLYAVFPGLGPAAFSLFISGIASFFAGLFSWITASLGYLVTMLTSSFTFIASFLGKMLNTLATAITQWVLMIQNIFSMISGGFGQTYNIFETFRLDIWIVIFAIFYPISLFAIWEEKGFDAMLRHLNMVINIFSWIFRVLITVVQTFITIIISLLELVPVAE